MVGIGFLVILGDGLLLKGAEIEEGKINKCLSNSLPFARITWLSPCLFKFVEGRIPSTSRRRFLLLLTSLIVFVSTPLHREFL